MKIDFVKEQEKAEIYNLWHICFGDTKKYMDWYFSKVYKTENTLALYCDGKIASSLQIIPYTLKLKDKEILCGYVAGVSTLPQFRYRGFSKALMEKADEVMKERGYSAAFLIPFNFDFYKKHGYKICRPNYCFEGEVSKLYEFKNNTLFKECKKFPKQVYNSFAETFDVCIKRDDNIFNSVYQGIRNADGFFCETEDSYIIYSIKDKTMNVLEMAYTTENGLKNLLGFIASQNINRFKIINAKKQDLHILFKNKEIIEKEFPQAMLKPLTMQNQKLIEGTSFLSMPEWI